MQPTHPEMIQRSWQAQCQELAWPTLLLALGTLLLVAANWYAVLSGIYGMGPGFVVSVVAGYLAFTVFHEASHGNIHGRHTQLRWLNDVVGWLLMTVLTAPYAPAKVIHLHHHAHTNDPEQDPDHWVVGQSALSTFFRCMTIFPAYYRQFLWGPVSKTAACRDILPQTFFALFLYLIFGVVMAVNGLGQEILMLWLLPSLVASGILAFAFDWLPHHPHGTQNKMHDTRILEAPMGNGLFQVMLLNQNYHLIHHLWPRIPFYRYARYYRETEDYLRSKNAPIEMLFTVDNAFNSSTQMAEMVQESQSLAQHRARPSHQATVVQVIEETADTTTLVLESEHWQGDYRPGQYIVLTVMVDGRALRRCYSLSSHRPQSNKLSITVKKQPHGVVSSHLQSIRLGERLTFEGPMGDFYRVDRGSPSHAIFLGAGSGITPLITMMEAHLAADDRNEVTLIYGNRTPDTVIFAQRLMLLEETYGERCQIHPVYSRHAGAGGGRLSGDLLKRLLAAAKNQAPTLTVDYYLCGPDPLVKEAVDHLAGQGIAQNQIHHESFGGLPPGEADGKSDIFHAVRLEIAGKNYDLEVNASETILEAALKKDIPLHYACGGGLCSTCLCKLVSGSVDGGENQALTEGEIQEGMILPCVSRPRSACTLEAMN